ncbi:MAG: RodZ domain-containing protein, partial [Verrucomicrobiota bacterium]|nr:RodZ domain-containing protein [Verrucomicrobiota bacterium]
AVQTSPTVESPAPNLNITPSTNIKEFKITANSEVYVAARDLTDRNYLFQGTLSAGEEIVLEKIGPVEVVFTRADQIIISANGQTFHSPESGITGTSKIRLP